MTDKVLIVISCGTDNPNRATRGLFFAATAHKQGKQAAVFLLDEGVFLARKGMATNVQAATGDKADDHLAYIQEFDIPVLVCTPCAMARQIEADDLIEGARMATGAEMISIACESTVISL
jgi:predicted peroxiredoxin